MIGLLMWKDRKKRDRPVSVGECAVLHVRFLKAEVARGPGIPEMVVRRRVSAALGQLRKQGITRVVLPESFLYSDLLEKRGLRPFPTLSLRRSLAADWVRAELAQRGLPVSGARVAVSADTLTGEVVRTVTELALRHRYVLLDLPRGGEELGRQLRREYGVSLLLAPSAEQLGEAEARVLFDERQVGRTGICLRLYDALQPLPPLQLPPALEERLPAGVDREQMLAALREAGALRGGQIGLNLPCMKNA